MKDLLIKEPNEFATARFEEDFSIIELRIFKYMLSNVNKKDRHFEMIEFKASDLIKLFKFKSNNFYNLMRKLSNKLIGRVIHIKKNNKLESFALYTKSETCKDKNLYQLKFNDDLKPYLLGKNNEYFIYYISNILNLKTKQLIRIYTYLVKILPHNKNEYTIKLTIEKLREDLNLEDKYRQFKFLKAFVLEKAKEEITKKTDLIFDYECLRDEKDKRKVKYIVLKITRKPQNKIEQKNIKEEVFVNKDKVCNMFKKTRMIIKNETED